MTTDNASMLPRAVVGIVGEVGSSSSYVEFCMIGHRWLVFASNFKFTIRVLGARLW